MEYRDCETNVLFFFFEHETGEDVRGGGCLASKQEKKRRAKKKENAFRFTTLILFRTDDFLTPANFTRILIMIG